MKNVKRIIKRICSRIKMELMPWGFIYSFIIFPIKKYIKKIGLGSKFYNDICSLKDLYQGERCFIIATGPSLTLEDVEMISDEYTIAVNSIYKFFSDTNWRPTYYVMTDPNLADIIVKNGIKSFDGFAKKNCIFNRLNRRAINCNNAIFIDNNWLDHVYHFGMSQKFKFDLRLELGVYDFYSVTQESILYAIYMGFTDIYILGADNNYMGEKKHFARIEGAPDYSYEQALKIQNSNDFAYSFLKEKTEELGIRITNVSRGGNIKVLPRMRLEEVVGNERS